MSDINTTLLQNMRRELANIKPSAIRSFNKEVSSIPGIIKLTLGEPDFDTPQHIKDAAKASIDNNHTHYPPTPGTDGLRAAAANFLNTKYNLNYKPTQILATVGATEAIWSSLYAITNPGDQVIVPTPILPMYLSIVNGMGLKPILVNTEPNDFVLSAQMIEDTLAQHDHVKAVLLNFPSNPTGKTYSREAIEEIAAVLRDKEIFVVSDEIYSELTYGKTHTSVAEILPEQTILLNGVSKSHAMTGWRLGIVAAPEGIIDKIITVHQFTVTTVPYTTQDAGEEAFSNGIDDALPMREEYIKRANFVHEAMTKMGFRADKPEGAFYYFAKLPEWLDEDTATFAHNLAYEQAVALVDATPFGPGAEGYIRISYASSMEDLQEAMKRIQKYLDSRRK